MRGYHWILVTTLCFSLILGQTSTQDNNAENYSNEENEVDTLSDSPSPRTLGLLTGHGPLGVLRGGLIGRVLGALSDANKYNYKHRFPYPAFAGYPGFGYGGFHGYPGYGPGFPGPFFG